MFGGSAKGLVRFDPLKRIVQCLVSKESISNRTEFVTMTVDLTQGSLWPDSDQDAESMTVEKRVETVLASVVEPALAEPVFLKDFPGRNEGMFIDGGLRSGLPVAEAVRRGAERVVVLSASSLDPPPVPEPKNGGQILFRSLDLFVYQLRDAEVQQAEGRAIARRVAERELCVNRFEKRPAVERDAVCGAAKPPVLPPPPPPDFVAPRIGKVATWSRGRSVKEVEDVWRSIWVFRGEKAGTSATNYEFDPKQMGPLFLSGVVDFRHRCSEVLGLLGFSDTAVNRRCSDVETAKLVTDTQKYIEPEGGSWPEKQPKIEDCR
jgi:hypothetical protein